MKRSALVMAGCSLFLSACLDDVVAPVEERATPSSIASPAAGPATMYRAVELGTLGGTPAVAHAMNAAGTIVGTSTVAGDRSHAFAWEAGVMRDLGTVGEYSAAQDVNGAGLIVGTVELANRIPRAVVWIGGTAQLLPLGSSYSYANAINSAGHIAGSHRQDIFSNFHRPYLLRDGTVTDLALLPGAVSCQPNDVNDLDQVVGVCFLPGLVQRAFLWDAGVTRDLGSFGGDYTVAWAINNLGQVVGASRNTDGNARAFLWEAGSMRELGTLGGPVSVALGINDSGQITGGSDTGTGRFHAYVWSDGSFTDLGTLGGNYSQGWSINNQGHVVGNSRISTGEVRAALWERTVVAPSPHPLVRQLADGVERLRRDALIGEGQSRSLLAKLSAAGEKIEQGNDKAATRILEAFVNELGAWKRSGVLPAGRADPLIALASTAISMLQGEKAR